MTNAAAFTEHLPDLLADFLLEHPQIDLDIEARPSHVIVNALIHRYAELGVLAEGAGFEGLESRPFRVDRLVLICGRDHPGFIGRSEVSFEETLNHSFVGLSSDNPLQQHLREKALKAGAHMNLRTHVASFESQVSLVARGVGLAVVPETVLNRCKTRPTIKIIRLSNTWAVRSLHLCACSFDEISPQAQMLAEQIVSSPEAIGILSKTGDRAGREALR